MWCRGNASLREIHDGYEVLVLFSFVREANKEDWVIGKTFIALPGMSEG